MDYNSRKKHGSLGYSKESVQVSRAEERRSGGRGSGSHGHTRFYLRCWKPYTAAMCAAGGVQSKVLKPYTPLHDGPVRMCERSSILSSYGFLVSAVVSSYYLIEKYPRARTHARTYILASQREGKNQQ